MFLIGARLALLGFSKGSPWITGVENVFMRAGLPGAKLGDFVAEIQQGFDHAMIMKATPSAAYAAPQPAAEEGVAAMMAALAAPSQAPAVTAVTAPIAQAPSAPPQVAQAGTVQQTPAGKRTLL